MKPSLGVVVPTHEFNLPLQSCLEALKRQSPLNFEILVVDNPGNPQTAQFVARLGPPFKYFVSEKGVNHARALGALKAESQWCLFLDSDCVLENPFSIEEICKLTESQGGSGFGGLYRISEQANIWGKTYHEIQLRWLADGALEYGFSKYLLGGFCCLKKSILQEEGFDTSIVFGGSETELFLRLIRSGHQFQILPSLTVSHDLNISWQQFIQKAFAQGKGHQRLVRRKLLNHCSLHVDFRISPVVSENNFRFKLFEVAFVLGQGLSFFLIHFAKKFWIHFVYIVWLGWIRKLRAWQILFS